MILVILLVLFEDKAAGAKQAMILVVKKTEFCYFFWWCPSSLIFLLLLQGERCRRGFLTRGCSAAFTEAVEAASAKAKSFLYKFFKQASLLSFLRLSDPRGWVDHEAVFNPEAAQCRCCLVYAAVPPVCWEEIVLMLLLFAAAEGSELPNALAAAAARGHRTAVSHARVPAADNNGRPSLPAGPYNPSSCWEARARILHAFNEFLSAVTETKLYHSFH